MLLRPDVVDQPGMLDRFRREVKLARRVTHRNVARARTTSVRRHR
jgi:serine/threonine-protein kinase